MSMLLKYPSIEQYRTVIKVVRDNAKFHGVPLPKLTFTGTVKLHGTNAAVVQQGDERWAQSRERVITPLSDNAGFAQYVEAHAEVYDLMFSVIKFMARAERIENFDENTTPIAVYGEWCGKGVQGGVGIGQVDKRFVVFGVRIGSDEESIWMDRDFIFNIFVGMEPKKTDISDTVYTYPNSHKLYNIFQFKTWEIEIDFANPELTQNQLIDLTIAVEEECPVAKEFGVSGIGEGIVWSCKSLFNNHFLRFKVKGEKHSVSKVKTLAEVDVEKVNSINEFVDRVVTENRLKQMKSKLVELGLDPADVTNIGTFLKLLGTDVVKEENDTLEASGLTNKEVMGRVNRAGRDWFIANLDAED